MTFSELVQLYVPLAGLVGLAFWVGALGERVKNLREDVRKLQDESTVAEAPAVVRMDEKLTNVVMSVEKLTRGMDHVQRQLGNLMQKGVGQIIELRTGPD